MANLTGPSQAFHSDTSVVDSSQQFTLGLRSWDTSGNEYMYLKGTASTVAGDWTVYDKDFGTTRLVPNEVGSVAIAMEAIVVDSFGWYQVYGINSIARTDTIAKDNSLYIDGTVGRADDAGVVGDLIIGAYSLTADTSNVATVSLNYPTVSNDLGSIAGCLTAPAGVNSTFCLTDNSTDQTLTGDLGELNLVPKSGLILQSNLASAASEQYAFNLDDRIDRSTNAGDNVDMVFRLHNSVENFHYMKVSARGEFSFGLGGASVIIEPQDQHVLAFLQNTSQLINNVSPSSGILALISMQDLVNSYGFVDGILGAILVDSSVAPSDLATTSNKLSALTGQSTNPTNDTTGFSSKVFSAIDGHWGNSSLGGIHGTGTDFVGSGASREVNGDWEHVTTLWLGTAGRRGMSATMNLYDPAADTTNFPAICSTMRIPIAGFGNATDGDSCAIYGDDITGTAVKFFENSKYDRAYFIRLVYPSTDAWTRTAHMHFVGYDTGTGGHGAPAGGEEYDEVGGVYFDRGTNNQVGLYEHDGTRWSKLISEHEYKHALMFA